MNILLVTETYLPYISGVSTSTDSIARYMVSQGHRVVLVNPKPVIHKVLKSLPGLKLVYSPSLPDLFYKGKPFTVFPFGTPTIKRAIEQTKFDVCHIQEPGSLGLSALFLARKHGIPTVGALHFTPEQIGRIIPGKPEKLVTPFIEFYIQKIYNKYTAIMVPTQTFSDFLKSVGVKRPISVVSNGVDTEKFHPGPLNLALRKRYNISPKEVVFFFIGRLDRDKNAATLIKALPFVDKSVKLLIIGKGKVEKYLHELADELKVKEKIVWIREVTDKEMVSFYQAADGFSIMSPYEVQSIVTLQAIASGLPVIAAKAGALPELVHENENGFLVDTYDARTLAERMNKVACDENLRKEFGKKSRQISLVHNKLKVLHRLELLYQSVSGRVLE